MDMPEPLKSNNLYRTKKTVLTKQASAPVGKTALAKPEAAPAASADFIAEIQRSQPTGSNLQRTQSPDSLENIIAESLRKMNSSDVMKGVIFSEILGKPLARRRRNW
jgi:hypothetical protein